MYVNVCTHFTHWHSVFIYILWHNVLQQPHQQQHGVGFVLLAHTVACSGAAVPVPWFFPCTGVVARPSQNRLGRLHCYILVRCGVVWCGVVWSIPGTAGGISTDIRQVVVVFLLCSCLVLAAHNHVVLFLILIRLLLLTISFLDQVSWEREVSSVVHAGLCCCFCVNYSMNVRMASIQSNVFKMRWFNTMFQS